MLKHKILNKNRKEIEVNLTPLKAIRLNCLDCACFSSNEVRLCNISHCALYPYKFGKNPSIKRIVSEASKEKSRKRIQDYHKNRQQSEFHIAGDMRKNG